MRKIVMINRISADGYFASLNESAGGMDWFVPDPEVDKALRSNGGQADTVIFGKLTFKMFENHWPQVAKDPNAPKQAKAVADELTNMTKVVFSESLKESSWENTTFYNGDLARVVSKLKSEKGDVIVIFGSGTIVQQLANEGLIDEYLFIVTPVVAGTGKPLFKDVKQFGLKFLGAQGFASGNVLLRYELAN